MATIESLRWLTLHRCSRLVLQRSAWSLLVFMLDTVDQGEWTKRQRLVHHATRHDIRDGIGLNLPVLKKARAELTHVRVIVRLDPERKLAMYLIDPQFTPPPEYQRGFGRDVPLALGLERDKELGLGLAGRQLRNELGRRRRIRDVLERIDTHVHRLDEP